MIRKPYVNKGVLGKSEEQDVPIKQQSGGYNIQAQEDQYGGGQNADLVPCRQCGRKFLPDRVGKHEKVCQG
jgi:hypothetical protein